MSAGRIASLAFAAAALAACSRGPELPILSQLPQSALVDASGQPFNLKDLEGQVWVGHFMFTRCGGPCPRMVAEFASLQKEIGPRDGLAWVSITADPRYDTPAVLTEYAGRFGADPERWHFLTGEVDAIYQLAEEGFLLPVEETSKEEGLITHSLKFVVVDPELRIRAFHDHFDPENAKRLAEEIDALIAQTKDPS